MKKKYIIVSIITLGFVVWWGHNSVESEIPSDTAVDIVASEGIIKDADRYPRMEVADKVDDSEIHSGENTDNDDKNSLSEINEEAEIMDETDDTAENDKTDEVNVSTQSTSGPIETSHAESTEEKRSDNENDYLENFNGKSNLNVKQLLLPTTHSRPRLEKLTHIVLHFTSNALNNPENPYKIEDTYDIFNTYGVSAHYVIDREGTIYLLVEEERIAYHAGKGELPLFPEYKDALNHYSIGIELLAIGAEEEMIPVIGKDAFDRIDKSLLGYTEQQYNSLELLINDIVGRHPLINKSRTHIVGHDEYSPGRKTDPGRLFNWGRIGL
jgi:N-acetyl-anhydromuramyl-L-alanine amidase AmpD